MFFNSNKEIKRLSKEINNLLCKNDVANLIKEINRLRKEINGLLSKRMPNIYLKVTLEMFSKRRLSEFKKFVTRSVFEELQLTHISSIFQTSCCNLKIRGLGAKLCAAFLLF